jgi:hypothetical protein
LYDIQIRILDFPTTKVTETVTQNADGSYTIFLNSRMTQERQLESYLHAMRHITNNDFERHNVEQIEVEAHQEEA